MKDIPLPGKPTRFDYQSYDEQKNRLYISHMGDGELVVFDTKAEKVVTNLSGFPVITGVLVVPSLKKVYGSVTKNHEMAVVDTEKLSVIKRIPDGKFPDGLAYSPETRRIFVSDESGEVETVIDAMTDEKIGTIKMGGEVGNTQYDPTSHLIYACEQKKNQFVAIDPEKKSIVARYDLKGGKHPHGFYIDDQHNKAYIACQGDAKLIVFDLATHQEKENFPIGGDPDVLAYDRKLNVLYVACESGVVSIFECGDKLIKLADQKVGANCHSVAVDSETHKVYFPLKNVKGAPLLRIMIPKESP
ncbi:MAG: YncE family protein [Verrucomicrobiota bacterium]|nr:YncE family protein [Verrucomicrobiota bacterium]